jgi:coatomer subunit alpha
LSKKIGLVNPAPLEQLFREIYFASHASVPGLPFTSSLSLPLTDPAGGPFVLFTPQYLAQKLGSECLQQTGVGNSSEALAGARYCMHALALTVAQTEEEEKELMAIFDKARRYGVAMLVESTRRTISTDPSQKSRELELAVYLSCLPGLDNTHQLLVIGSAMNIAFRARNFVLACHLARRIITGSFGNDELVVATTMRARKVLAAAEEKGGTDEREIDFDPSWLTSGQLKLCSGSLSPIHPSLHEQITVCPFCKSEFHPEWKSKLCTVCQLSNVGTTTLGLQLRQL